MFASAVSHIACTPRFGDLEAIRRALKRAYKLIVAPRNANLFALFAVLAKDALFKAMFVTLDTASVLLLIAFFAPAVIEVIWAIIAVSNED